MNKYLKIILPFFFLAAGVTAFFTLLHSAPKPEVVVPKEETPKVQVQAVTWADHQVTMELNGVVEPARQVALGAQVAGRLEMVDPRFRPGGSFQAGEVMARIEAQDYQTAVVVAEEALENARFQLSLEEGRQTVAREEWTLFADSIPATQMGKDLALRKPHLQAAEASVAAAESRLVKARRDVARTVIKAPFSGVVTERKGEVGQMVGTNSTLATLVGSEHYWVKVSLPYSRLNQLSLPNPDGSGGSEATLRMSGATTVYHGRIVQLLADLDPGSRMARLLVQVDRPRAGDQPLLLGAYVDVTLMGKPLTHLAKLPLGALREDGEWVSSGTNETARLWVLDGQQRLGQRRVDLVWRDAQHIYVSGDLQAGDLVVTGKVATPLMGMTLEPVYHEDTLVLN